MKTSKINFVKPVYDNDVDAFIPERWALEGLALLEENMVAANLVARNYEDVIAEFGDVVNVSSVSKFNVKRKGANDDIIVQNADAANIPVSLNQHLHTSFLIRDAQASMSFANLVAKFLNPAILSIASGVDKIVVGSAPEFLANAVGQLESMDKTNILSYILKGRKMMNDNLLPMQGRQCITDTNTEAIMLELEQFTNANQVGDDGTALREASIGRKYGINWYMGQNTPSVLGSSTDKVLGAVNNAAGYAPGTATITVDGFSAAITNGSYVTIAGSMYPYVVTGSVGGATPTSITISPVLRDDIVDNAVVTVYTPILVDLTAGYANGYVKEIHVDGFTNAPQVGQIVRDAGGNVYTVMEVSNVSGSECDILLNTPIKMALANNAVLGVGPAGSYNFGFVADALALVTRPLALPATNLADAAVINDRALSIRVVMTYDGTKQGHLVTVDMLCGVAKLDEKRGLVILG